MTETCRDNGIELILVKAPVLYPYWYPEWDEQMVKFADANGLRYINFLDHQDETGLDYSADTFNGGLHLNVYGAEKLTSYFGKILRNEYNVTDRREDMDLKQRWERLLEKYHETKEDLAAYYDIKGVIKPVVWE
jgi:hypothetical protein